MVNLAEHAEFQGAVGVVLNAQTPNETIEYLNECIDIPLSIIVSEDRI